MKPTLNASALNRCLNSLENAYIKLQSSTEGTTDYDIYRNAVIKSFELSLETAAKLLRKSLAEYASDTQFSKHLSFKDTFRQAAKYGLISVETVEHWFEYRTYRNETAHDYGEPLAENALSIIEHFIPDAKALEQLIEQHDDPANT